MAKLLLWKVLRMLLLKVMRWLLLVILRLRLVMILLRSHLRGRNLRVDITLLFGYVIVGIRVCGNRRSSDGIHFLGWSCQAEHKQKKAIRIMKVEKVMCRN